MRNITFYLLSRPRIRSGLSMVGVLFTLFLLTTDRSYAQSCMPYPAPQARFGFNVALNNGRTISSYNVAPLRGHWYLDYATQKTPPSGAGMVYAQMIRPPLWKSSTFTKTVEAVIANNPGALWIVGNEPDRDKQDGMKPDQYAVFYHSVYNFLKARDPSAHIAIAGIVQSTPLRRRYLDMILDEYQNRYGQAMPVDVWTMHAFILAENDPQWGAWNPPGLEAYAHEGIRYAVTDHNNMTIFKANIVAFRQWMADRGYRDKPLLVTEYGILIPDYYFPYAKVKSFMLATFDFLLTSTDATIGYPADNNRLVQAWSWFSLNYPPYEEDTNPTGMNGNLVAPDTGVLQPLGQDYGAYISKLTSPQALTLTVSTAQVTPAIQVITTTTPVTTPITFAAVIANTGNVSACDLTIRLDYQDPQGKQTRLATQTFAALPAVTAADNSHAFSHTWQPATLPLGQHKLILTLAAYNSNTGLATTQVRQEYSFLVVDAPLDRHLYLPYLQR